MQDKVVYEYAVIRVVPKVEREEFINIGLILFSKRKRYIKFDYHIPEEKNKKLLQRIRFNSIKGKFRIVC